MANETTGPVGANSTEATGYPGIEPRWTSSAKSAVGTSVSAQSQLWFTLSFGIVNEVYYPRLDQANIRDLGLIVTGDGQFFSEEKRHTTSTIQMLQPGVPAYRLVNQCNQGRYRIEKTIFSDPRRPCLLQRVRFEPLVGSLSDYQLFALLAPHLGNRGADNSGWAGDYKGFPMLFAHRDDAVLAFACSQPWRNVSTGYVGSSDGFQVLSSHQQPLPQPGVIRPGNIALTAEVDLPASGAEFVMALAFGRTAAEAGQRAVATLMDPWEQLLQEYVAGWNEYQSGCLALSGSIPSATDHYRSSTAVLKTHSSKHFVGGMIASLSIPWGFNKGDDDLGGYHLVWPRDQVESAGALLACGDTNGARDVLRFLLSTQEADGHWPQNMWLDGTPYWNGIQLDETALPILLADALRRSGKLDGIAVWASLRKAAAYLVRNGPVTGQDRWEEDGGYAPFTLAAVVSGLLAAADFADEATEWVLAEYLREVADTWNDQIERWTYVTGTALAKSVEVQGYYVRIAPPEIADAASPAQGFVPIKNRPPGNSEAPAEELICPDALALVRFGLRAAEDPKILDTVKVIDAMLRSESSTGVLWHRYNEDGYGEHEDGSPFDGTGVGRGWPLLAGERAHYELALNHVQEAERLCHVMEQQAGDCGLFPEQIWDARDIPERRLFNGRPSGSAMPLVWAHAEYIKLRRSLRDGKVFDLPPQTVQRYQVQRLGSPYFSWRFTQKSRELPLGKILRVETEAPAVIHWSTNGWVTRQDTPTVDTTIGLHKADLPTANLPVGTSVVFTFFWIETKRWEGGDFSVRVT